MLRCTKKEYDTQLQKNISLFKVKEFIVILEYKYSASSSEFINFILHVASPFWQLCAIVVTYTTASTVDGTLLKYLFQAIIASYGIIECSISYQ